ncbi:DUF971 domain-containing protein [Xinfangfangia sp. D13-10-4-6]|uniref:TauD/TfdA family dioxygenase n=1 Tax=Pseudogemmobacter hezensis TaxID=2737662 RepID=UPI0015516B42|nr:TauD/TfdA family dioxygenase [Pseudogemmobacter hezensis]NPD16356.1 DUF971 domain-containing protein [Pseudogemmobacter hezensis]
MDMTIEKTAELGASGLTLDLASGKPAYFNYYWLRDNCPTSFNTTTRERSFDIFHLSEAPRPLSTVVTSAGLDVAWNDGHSSHYPMEFLEQYASGTLRHDPADLPRKAWYGDHYPDVARFTHAELLADKTKVRAWLEAMLVEGVSVVTGMPDSNEGLTQLVNVMGQVRPTFFGDYFDVKTHIKPTNTAYTSAALELHTDTPAEEHAPGVQFLHMRRNSVEGGRNLFGDGVAAANDFRKIDPEGFRILSETDVPFYCEHDTYDMRSRQRIIELDQHGEVSGLTISQHMLDIIDLPQTEMDRFYPAFCAFGKLLQSDRYIMRFTLQAGECIVFDNHRIVHGRAAYSATSGERYLRGCYADRAEMRSTWRALVSEGRFRA